MKIGRLPILLGFIGALPLLAGCQSFANRFADRYGPAPVLDATAVSNAVDNQLAILAALARASGTSMPALTPSPDWYFVMEGGFNYVDERCDQYMTDLFIANREKDKIKGLAILADKTTSAILGAAGASTQAITIVAQSFGFAEGATDLVANSYLYQIDPAHIQNLVVEMRKAYRRQAYQRQKYFNTPTLAYHGVQRYLELCLPQTIDAKINEIVARAQGFPDPTTPQGPFTDVLVGSQPPLTRREAAAAQDIPTQQNVAVAQPAPPAPSPPRHQPVAKNPAPGPGDGVRVGSFEKGLLESEVRDFQRAACLSSDGKFTAETRSVILAFLKSQGLKDPAFPDRITAKDGTRLRDILDAGAPRCGAPPPPDGVRVGAFEKGLLESEVRDFQRAACLSPDGRFTAETRTAILALLKSKGLKDPAFPDRITAKDGTRLRDILGAGPPRCGAPPPPDSVQVGAFEKGLLESEVRDFQRAACLSPDGKFTAETRTAILALLKSKGLKDPAFPDRITAKDGTRLRDILDAGPHC